METFFQEHAAVAIVLFGTLATLLGALALSVLKQIDANQTKLNDKLDTQIKEINSRIAILEQRFYVLQGEHNDVIRRREEHLRNEC